MSFRKLLTHGETVVVELRPHWSYLGWPLVSTVAVIVGEITAVIAWHGWSTWPVWSAYLVLGFLVVPALWLVGRAARWWVSRLLVTNLRLVQRSGAISRTTTEVRLDRVNELSYRQSLGGRILRMGSLMVETGGEAGVIEITHVPRPGVLQGLITEQLTAFSRHSSGWGGSGNPVPCQAGPANQSPSQYGSAPSYDSAPDRQDSTPPRGSLPIEGLRGTAAPTSSAGGPATTGHVVGDTSTVADRLVQLDELRSRGIVSESEYQQKKRELLDRL